jgi:hypothetical protein
MGLGSHERCTGRPRRGIRPSPLQARPTPGRTHRWQLEPGGSGEHARARSAYAGAVTGGASIRQTGRTRGWPVPACTSKVAPDGRGCLCARGGLPPASGTLEASAATMGWPLVRCTGCDDCLCVGRRPQPKPGTLRARHPRHARRVDLLDRRQRVEHAVADVADDETARATAPLNDEAHLRSTSPSASSSPVSASNIRRISSRRSGSGISSTRDVISVSRV